MTVTTKAEDYVFILHKGGMANIKVEDLSQELLIRFGYIDPPKPQTNSLSGWSKGEILANIQSPTVTKFQESVLAQVAPVVDGVQNAGLPVIAGAALVLALVYAFSAYCCMLICQKAGTKPGILVWIPVLNLIPLLRAARMSPAWFIGFLFPLINLVTYIVWSFKIVHARGKQAWTAIWLILPFSSPFMVLYLAFSSAPSPAAKEKAERRPQVMTLETA